MSNGHGASPGERRGGRVAGTKNKATIEQENLISRAMGKLDRPLGKDVLAEVMVEFREMAKEQAEAARAGDKEAQQKRVYYQGTLETDKANYRALARWAGDGVWSTKEGCPSVSPIPPLRQSTGWPRSGVWTCRRHAASARRVACAWVIFVQACPDPSKRGRGNADSQITQPCR